MLLINIGFENFGASTERVACSREEFGPVARPAGLAGLMVRVVPPELIMIAPFVADVPVETFFTMVLFANVTSGASSMAIPPPAWVARLFAMMLF